MTHRAGSLLPRENIPTMRIFSDFVDHLDPVETPWTRTRTEWGMGTPFDDEEAEDTVNYSKPQERVRISANVNIEFILNVPQFEDSIDHHDRETRAIEDFIVRLKNRLFQANTGHHFSELTVESLSVGVGLAGRQDLITGDNDVWDRE